jgi:predicted ATPase
VVGVAAALGESRVVTITGVGRVGKTRMALQVELDQPRPLSVTRQHVGGTSMTR